MLVKVILILLIWNPSTGEVANQGIGGYASMNECKASRIEVLQKNFSPTMRIWAKCIEPAKADTMYQVGIE